MKEAENTLTWKVCDESHALPSWLSTELESTQSMPHQADPTTGFLLRAGCMMQAWPKTRRWQSQLHLLFIASSSMTACFDGEVVLVRNWGSLTCSSSLGKYEHGLLSHRRFHVMVPELQRLQLSALFRYLSKQGSLRRPAPLPKAFRLSAFTQRLQPVRYGLLRPGKFRNTRAINFRKNFLRLRRLYFERLRTSFFFGRIRPKTARRLLARFAHKRNLALQVMFSLNPHKLVCRVFPFLDRFLLRTLIRRGEVYVNGQRMGSWFATLKLGDMVRLSKSKSFFRSYKVWVNTHQAYIAIMGKSLHQYYKSQRQRAHKRRKQYLKHFTWYTGFYKAVPTWLEVSFISMSFFIVKTPAKLGFASSNFNPYLNRLLAFK